MESGGARAGKPITVLIRGGVYYLPQTLAFTPEDSGASAAAPVVYAAYPGETPLLSGGRPLAGAWTPRGNGIFSTAAAGPGVFRQLYVNGKRATVARTPNADAPVPWKRLKQWEPTTQSVRLDGPDNLSKNLQRQNQIEMVVKHHWAVARLHLGPWGTFDNDNVIFPPEKQVFKSPAPKENGQWYYLENALEYLDQARRVVPGPDHRPRRRSDRLLQAPARRKPGKGDGDRAARGQAHDDHRDSGDAGPAPRLSRPALRARELGPQKQQRLGRLCRRAGPSLLGRLVHGAGSG
jgi:hypothetical protein